MIESDDSDDEPNDSEETEDVDADAAVVEAEADSEEVPLESFPDTSRLEKEDATTVPDISGLAISDLNELSSPPPPSNPSTSTPAPVFEDPPSEDDGEGEWITPDNVASHKAKEVFSSPNNSGRKGMKTPDEPLSVACMTADYAMQNVLLHMGLNLVGVEGKKITSVKSWVLRCHACFK